MTKTEVHYVVRCTVVRVPIYHQVPALPADVWLLHGSVFSVVTGVRNAGCMQVEALAVKFKSVYWRTPSYNFVRYAITVASALVMGSIYYKAGE